MSAAAAAYSGLSESRDETRRDDETRELGWTGTVGAASGWRASGFDVCPTACINHCGRARQARPMLHHQR